jgi:FcoT-like thioesterase domain
MCPTALAVRPHDDAHAPKACASKTCVNKGCARLAAANENQVVAEAKPEVSLPAISKEFIADILKPYRTHAQYLRSAELTHFQDKSSTATKGKDAGLISAKGRFSIPCSCYIDDTGHFNAVEFNICFNQLAYVTFGKCLEANMLKNLRLEGGNVSFGDFKRHQLANMLIVSIESRYYKMLKSDDFAAELTINRISASAGAYFVFTSITFSDAEGVKAKGTVLLAFAPPKE